MVNGKESVLSYIVKNIGETATLGLVLRSSGTPITGESPTVEVRRMSDSLYLDWSAVSAPFWVSGGGLREKPLVEQSWMPGFYTTLFDQGLYDNTNNEYTVIYRNTGLYPVYDNEVFSFEQGLDASLAADVSFIRKILTNKQTLEQLSTTLMHHQVLDDDEVTPVYDADITINVGGNIETRQPL